MNSTCNFSKRKLTTNVNKSCLARDVGIVNLLHSAAPQCGSQGSNGGVKQGIGMRKMDLLAW